MRPDERLLQTAKDLALRETRLASTAAGFLAISTITQLARFLCIVRNRTDFFIDQSATVWNRLHIGDGVADGG